MNIYYLDINHCWTCIIWTYTTNGRCGGQLIPYVQIALEKAGLNI